MADNTHIEWTDATWQIVTGCSVVSPGCTNCYAMRLAGTRRRDHPSRAGLTIASKAGPVWNGQVRYNRQWLHQPAQWTRPRRIFVAAHGDLFHEGVADEDLHEIFAVFASNPQHTFQVLTKRPERARDYLSHPDRLEDIYAHWYTVSGKPAEAQAWPLPNVWLGVSVEDQARADQRIPILLDTPAAVRWISAEPLLGPVSLIDLGRKMDLGKEVALDAAAGEYRVGKPLLSDGEHRTLWGAELDWVVIGGESGPGARPMHPDWARALRSQCEAAGVPFLFKQWGDWGPVDHLDTDALDGRLYHPAPARHPDATRRERVPGVVLHRSGQQFTRPTFEAYAAGSGAMLMFQIGKKTTGRLLDDRLHDGYPQ